MVPEGATQAATEEKKTPNRSMSFDAYESLQESSSWHDHPNPQMSN